MHVESPHRLGTVVLGACALLMVALTPQASANTPIVRYSALPSTTQAGGHPDLEIQFTVENRQTQVSQSACNCEDAKDATVELPAGFIGNPNATPQCSLADFSANECPTDSQVGVVEISVLRYPFISAIYNVVPPPDVAGIVAFKIPEFGTPQFTVLSARTDSDYGLEAKTISIFHGLGVPLEGFREDLWGVPADPAHDPLRLDPRFNPNGAGLTSYLGYFCDSNSNPSSPDPGSIVKACGTDFGAPPPTASNSPLTPFLQNPTTCDQPLGSSLEILSYDGGTDGAQRTWPQGTGCNELGFNPSLYAQPTTDSTDSPSGVDVNLSVPQSLSPTLPSPTELRGATVSLPPGFSINSNAADGKVACTDAEAHFGTRDAAECPEDAKIGSLEIDSSALPGPLPGFVYLGEPLPGNRYRVFLTADAFATHVKLAGTVTPDPQTGQLTITFKDLPQSPLTAFNMHFFGADRGALATPTKCGTYAVTSTFEPWDSRLPPQTSTQYFELRNGPGGSPCPGTSRPFVPQFNGASVGNTAGERTPFAVDLGRRDGDQNVAGLTVKTPPGFSASLQGIPYCPESAIVELSDPSHSGLAELAAPACPSASEIGSAVVGVGAGSRPMYVTGKVYLAGPYKGSPLSLVVVVPAVAGPYDLGAVAVRAGIDVDPLTAEVTTRSDPLPQIIGGIPLRMRFIRVNLDRPGFAINPTNCEPLAVEASVSGSEGATSVQEVPYQVANCASLPYAPDLSLSLVGRLERRGHPAIRAVLSSKSGEANTKRVSVTLPNGELLDNSHIGTVCVAAEFANHTCPAASQLGTAEVTTPLLDHPLKGSVYLRASRHRLPDMALDLTGQFNIEAFGRIDSVHSRLRTTFEAVPDVPLSRIVLRLFGGRKGLVVNSESICGSELRALVRLAGQNGATRVEHPTVTAQCGGAGRRSRLRHHTRKVL